MSIIIKQSTDSVQSLSNTNGTFLELEQVILKFVWRYKIPQNQSNILRNKNKAGCITLPDFSMCMLSKPKLKSAKVMSSSSSLKLSPVLGAPAVCSDISVCMLLRSGTARAVSMTVSLLWLTCVWPTLHIDIGASVVDQGSIACAPQLQPGPHSRPSELSLHSQTKFSPVVCALKPKFHHQAALHQWVCISGWQVQQGGGR